jgi:Holliday junction resolvase RusA-like endonuclease
MSQTITIKGRMPGMNELVDANRVHPQKGAKLKKAEDEKVAWYAKAQGIKPVTDYPVVLKVTWIEPNRKRDPDNVASATKFLLDGLQKARILRGDGHREIAAIEHRFGFDATNPRVIVTLEGVSEV